MVDYHSGTPTSQEAFKLYQISRENLEGNKREKCKEIVNLLKSSMESHNYDKLENILEPKAVLNICNKEIIGRFLIQEFLEKVYKDVDIHLYPERILVDTEQMHVSVEFYTRRRSTNEKDSPFIENMASWYFKVSEDFNIKAWYIWIDTTYHKEIKDINEEIVKDVWKPSKHENYTFQDVSDILERKTVSFANRELDEWAATLHKDIIVRPPWDALCGLEDCKKGAEAFWKKYEISKINRIELLHDETQPNWAVYLQIFTGTNKKTGETGEDIDFIFVELVDSKVRYWKSYFNNSSNQSYTNTYKYFIQTIGQDNSSQTNPPNRN